MCGIVGYIGPRPILPILVEGLKRLEYRGYDSAGVSVVERGTLKTEKTEGKLSNLERLMAGNGDLGRHGGLGSVGIRRHCQNAVDRPVHQHKNTDQDPWKHDSLLLLRFIRHLFQPRSRTLTA